MCADEQDDLEMETTPECGDEVITVFRRMEAAGAGARAERDIMRAAIETIAAGTPDPASVAQDALDADRARREANQAALLMTEGTP